MMPQMSILSATTQHWYHLVEGEEERAKLTPQRDAILAILAQIPYDKFPELVEDLLVEAEGHIRVDVTDGPGDEKQDILTKTKAGERHLTQCKHTTKHTEKSSGDGLDVLFGACHRKNCRHGLYVTNGELTPQAKRYITDDEFRRLASGALELDYWDAKRIWERIERSPNVLKKWFGGMVQADGLRLFYFDIVVQNCPRSILLCAHQMIDYLGDPGQIGAPDLKYTVEESVKADAQIDVPYVVSEERAGGSYRSCVSALSGREVPTLLTWRPPWRYLPKPWGEGSLSRICQSGGTSYVRGRRLWCILWISSALWRSTLRRSSFRKNGRSCHCERRPIYLAQICTTRRKW